LWNVTKWRKKYELEIEAKQNVMEEKFISEYEMQLKIDQLQSKSLNFEGKMLSGSSSQDKEGILKRTY